MTMRYRAQTRRVRVSGRGRGLLLLAAVVLIAGLFAQVTMLARVSLQSRSAAALTDEIEALNAQADNLEMAVNGFHNLEQIRKRALQLGMEVADGTSTRVVNVALGDTNDAGVQTAEGPSN